MKKQYTVIMFAAATLALATQADIFGIGANQFSLDFVSIGNPGNAGEATPDPRGPFGAVAYRYRIGKHEVTIDQFMKARATDGRIGNGNENYWNDGTRTVGPNAPVSYTTWYEAAMFSNWLTTGDAHSGVYQFDGTGTLLAVDRSFRNGLGLAYVLPSEDEWYKAAYFDASGNNGYSLYAHGADTAPLWGTNGWNYSLGGAGGLVNPPPNYTWETGFGGEEQNGTFDMMGNVFEWCESAEDGILDNMTESRTIRNGAFTSVVDSLDSSNRAGGSPEGEHHSYGFRVAAIPEPGSVGLMGVGSGILLFARRHRRRRKTGAPPWVKDCGCDTFNHPVVQPVVPHRSCWDLLDSCDRMATRAKQKALHGLDAFLALVMK